MTLKITTWNVNGLRAIINKGFREWVLTQKMDVLCLQEIKARPEQVPDDQREFLNYYSYWNPAQRPGYSGVASYTVNLPVEVHYGLSDERFDDEGRVIRLKFEGFYLYNIYFPNGQRGKERVDYKLDFYAKLLEICDHHHRNGEQVIITGDFNTAHEEIDLANPKENAQTSGFMPEEREWVSKYLEHGFVDAYRKLYPDRVQYTWWTYRVNARVRNIGWRLDYYLVSEPLMSRVQDVIIHDEVNGSDHCPVSLLLENSHSQ